MHSFSIFSSHPFFLSNHTLRVNRHITYFASMPYLFFLPLNLPFSPITSPFSLSPPNSTTQNLVFSLTSTSTPPTVLTFSSALIPLNNFFIYILYILFPFCVYPSNYNAPFLLVHLLRYSPQLFYLPLQTFSSIPFPLIFLLSPFLFLKSLTLLPSLHSLLSIFPLNPPIFFSFYLPLFLLPP